MPMVGGRSQVMQQVIGLVVEQKGQGKPELTPEILSRVNEDALHGKVSSALITRQNRLPSGELVTETRAVEALTLARLKAQRSKINNLISNLRANDPTFSLTPSQQAGLRDADVAITNDNLVVATDKQTRVLGSLQMRNEARRELRGVYSERAKGPRFQGMVDRARREIAAKRALGMSGPELDAYENAVKAAAGADPTKADEVTLARNSINAAKGAYKSKVDTLSAEDKARNRLVDDQLKLKDLVRKAEKAGISAADLAQRSDYAKLDQNIKTREGLLQTPGFSIAAVNKFGDDFGRSVKIMVDGFKDFKKPTGWEHSRASRIGRAMVARAIMGQVSGFAGDIITSEGDAVIPNIVTGSIKAGTSAGTAYYTNKLITGDPKDAAKNLTGLIGFGIADIITGAFQKFVQRGLGLRREATATMHQQEVSFAKSIMPDPSIGIAGYNLAKYRLGKGLTVTGKSASTEEVSFGVVATPAMMRERASKLSQEDVMEGQRQVVTDLRRAAVQRFVHNESPHAGEGGWHPNFGGYNWRDTITFDQMYAGMGALGGAGARAGLLAKYYQSKGYNIAGGEMGMFDLGARVAGISANSELSGQTVAQLMASEYLGFGTGINGAFGLAKATQMGLPGAVANQIGTSIAQSGLQGLNLNQDKETAYIKSLTASGMSRGRVGMLFNAGLQGRQQARAAIGGGFKDMMGQAALLAALEAGGDLSSAMDVAAGMSSYDQMQAMRRYFGNDITKMTLQSNGLTGADALKAMSAGPDKGSSVLDPILALATQGNIIANRDYLNKMAGEKGVAEENRAQGLKESLDSAAQSLSKAAGMIGELIPQ